MPATGDEVSMRAHPFLALLLTPLLTLTPVAARAQEQTPLGIGLEGFAYPFPVRFLR